MTSYLDLLQFLPWLIHHVCLETCCPFESHLLQSVCSGYQYILVRLLTFLCFAPLFLWSLSTSPYIWLWAFIIKTYFRTSATTPCFCLLIAALDKCMLCVRICRLNTHTQKMRKYLKSDDWKLEKRLWSHISVLFSGSFLLIDAHQLTSLSLWSLTYKRAEWCVYFSQVVLKRRM